MGFCRLPGIEDWHGGMGSFSALPKLRCLEQKTQGRQRQPGGSKRPNLKSGSALRAQYDLSRKQEFTRSGGSTADTLLTSVDP